MQYENYRKWLAEQNYQSATITAQMHRTGRVEEHYGDLDLLYSEDRLEGVILELTYTAQDQRNNRPNESKIPFDGDAYKNLASYRDAVRRYKRFLEDDREVIDVDSTDNEIDAVRTTQAIGLEKDMQTAIRHNIDLIEQGLKVLDGGREKSVETGFIDIFAEDMHKIPVVIELKTGVAGQRAVAQILSYMGSIIEEQSREDVRGILVASDFDKKARAAAKVIPSLSLVRYQFSFNFFIE
ncbi:hypothetical protein BCT11_09145 [Vibrio sp. 10N.222.52.B12]|uniref:endonuclease NucS domain-containing protein n=1 Tax=Vibrio sp. 10N.222.52.B12 TaxID=1880840 RepID=UPI000C8640E8|nr:endonuclease NucS domain-containing protein [Vibrio sp. 10N.222.52.B12]PMO43508.1 hypothetical protein BCT11_09145 [Vibrio sp. 10N.222.52.B12]